MTWRDQYLQASYKGVPFNVESVDGSYAKRTTLHEFGGRDGGETEELGNRLDEFSVTGYLVGDDYMEQLQNLLDVVRSHGPGQLVHPYRGVMNVKCLGLNTKEDSKSGGLVKISLKFRKEDTEAAKKPKVNTKRKAQESAQKLRDAADEDFSERYTTKKLPNFISEELAADLRAITAEIGYYAHMVEEIAYYANNLDLVKEKIIDYAIELGFGTDGLHAVYNLEHSLYSISVVEELTKNRETQAKNQKAIIDLVASTVISVSAENTVQRTFATYSDAVNSRDILLDAIDQLQERTESNEIYQAMQALRVDIFNALPPEGEDLPSLVTLQAPDSYSSVLIAYQMYGDPNRHLEITERNQVRNGAFCPAGSLEVLNA